MEYDLHHNILPKVVLAPVVIGSSTTTVGAIIDTKGFESLDYSILSGVITDGAYTVVLEEGDDSGLSDAAVVPAELVLDALPAFADTEDGVAKSVGSIGKKRYQRLSIVSTGVTTGGLFSVAAVLSHVKHGSAQ